MLFLISAIMAIIYTILAVILMYLAMPVVMAENKSGISAVKASYNLAKSDKAGIFAIFVLVGIISLFVYFIIGSIETMALGPATAYLFSSPASIAMYIIFMLIIMLISAFIYSWLLVTSGLMYLAYRNGTLNRKSKANKSNG